MSRTTRFALLALSTLACLLPTATALAATEEQVRDELVQAVVRQIPGATVRQNGEEPLVGVPGVEQLARGRAEVMMDPAFWTQIVGNLLVSRTIVLPKPVDLVKPEMYLPTVPVANGGKVWPLRREVIDLPKITYEWQGRKKTLRDYMRSTETDAIAFVHNGTVVGDLYANGWSADVRHQPWSVTKSFISAVIGIAIDEGRVRSIAEPIDAYIPELRGTAWQGVTIENLLQMESGVHWDEGTPVLVVNTQVEQWIQAALDLYTNGALGQGRNEFLKALPKAYEQGTKFSYNSGNTQVLAWLAETVYKKPFAEIVSEKLWVPVGMAGDARMMTDRVGDAIASQGLYSRIFDLARFGELFRNGGRTPDGRQIVSQRWVRESTTKTAVSKGQYAFQWWQGPTPDSYEASGFQGQKISVSPVNCLTGVRLAHTLGADMSDGFAVEMGAGEWNTVYTAVVAKLGGCAAPAARPGAKPKRPRGLRVGKATVRRGALRVAITTRRRARVSITAATSRGQRLGSRRVTLAPGTRTVTLRLTKRGRAVVRGRRSLMIVVTARGAGERTSRTLTLRR